MRFRQGLVRCNRCWGRLSFLSKKRNHECLSNRFAAEEDVSLVGGD